ncbi:choice-of-anchor A family protein [Nevskia soli]|uniref:choice-of-anchor A family protein n=1 Tax=Nevskia soli TaxID=418856 RepID=UPI0015D81DDB|nr:choice-of-anchor A family protein [Nevskia soli]
MKSIQALALLCGAAACASASDLGVAEGYNVFTFGNFSGNADSQGRVAVGGNATLTNFGIGNDLGSSSSLYPYSLVVGGNLTYQNGQTDFGGIAVGGNATLTSVTSGGNMNVGGTLNTTGGQIDGMVAATSWINQNTGGPSGISGSPAAISSIVDFAGFQSTIDNESTSWGALAQTGTATLSYGTLTLSGTNSGLNVFDITTAQLAAATGGFVIDAPAGSTVLINVDGGSGTFPNTGYSVNGVSYQNVLFNFTDATSLTGSGGLYGSILAPDAAFTFNNGQINGTVIALSMSGTGETHYAPFSGNLPGVNAVPEPGSLTLLSSGAALMAGAAFLGRLRKKSTQA